MKITDGDILLYIGKLKKEEKSRNTTEKYLRDIKRFTEYVKGEEITKETVLAYKEHLQRKYKPRSVNSMLAGINGIFEFMCRYDLRVKAIKLQAQIYCPEEKELTRGEYERLVRTAKEKGRHRLSLIIQTICSTGIRVSELNYITAEAVRRGEATVSLKGKTRTVFIPRALREKLLLYAKEQNISSGNIFVTRSGKAVCRTNIWKEMKKLCRESGVKESKVFPHNLRHLFARVYYKIEKDIAKLADILGHSSINTTRIYIISTGAEHRKDMERMRLII